MSATRKDVEWVLSRAGAAWRTIGSIQMERLRRETLRVARQTHRFCGSLRPQAIDQELTGGLAAHSAALTAELERATEVIAHLRRVEIAYCAARESLDQYETAYSELKRLAAHSAALTAELERATEVIAHLRRVEIAYCAAREALDQYETAYPELKRLADDSAALAFELERAREEIAHLRRVEIDRCKTPEALDQNEAPLKVANDELKSARSGAQEFVNLWQRILFETGQTTDASRSAAILVSGDRPIKESLETLVNLSEAAHGARSFQYIVPFLGATKPFPEPWPSHMPPLRIIDIGSQELASEEDMYAPLRRVAPVEVIGFDPFAQEMREVPGEPMTVRRPDGTVVLTYPNVVADGAPVTLHVNRYDPTSSIFPSNLALARQFGLLGAALETVETRNFSSVRLDDVIPDVRVDLLKVDVQGAAHAVLANATRILANTLVCHVEAEFAPIYVGERLFSDIDILLREAGFSFVDFYSLGRQRYARFEDSPDRAFHRGRTLWADCIYVRGLDTPDALTDDELLRAALVVHACYNKQDLASELLGRLAARRANVSESARFSARVADPVSA
jgi:FkbM family methyltransferase